MFLLRRGRCRERENNLVKQECTERRRKEFHWSTRLHVCRRFTCSQLCAFHRNKQRQGARVEEEEEEDDSPLICGLICYHKHLNDAALFLILDPALIPSLFAGESHRRREKRISLSLSLSQSFFRNQVDRLLHHWRAGRRANESLQ